jgi:hypothetical protein
MLHALAVIATTEQFESMFGVLETNNRRDLNMKFPKFRLFMLDASSEHAAHVFYSLEDEDLRAVIVLPGVLDVLAERPSPGLWVNILIAPTTHGHGHRLRPEVFWMAIAQPKIIASRNKNSSYFSDAFLCLYRQSLRDTFANRVVLDTLRERPLVEFARILVGSVDTYPRLDSERKNEALLWRPNVLATLMKHTSPTALNKMFGGPNPEICTMHSFGSIRKTWSTCSIGLRTKVCVPHSDRISNSYAC